MAISDRPEASGPAGSAEPGRWGPEARPRLASKVRLQWNAARSQALLLYPEGALVLNPTARAVLELCDGRTLAEIVRELASRFDGSAEAGSSAASSPDPVQLSTDPGTDAPDLDAAPAGSSAAPGRQDIASPSPSAPEAGAAPVGPAERERIVERDVRAFLARLDQRGWVVDAAAAESARGAGPQRPTRPAADPAGAPGGGTASGTAASPRNDDRGDR